MDDLDNREVVIQVDHLTKDYGFGRGVFDVSIKVHKGECYGYLGPNGAGKSTTIRHIMGFAKPTKGKITIFGKESFNHTEELLGKVGYLPGEPSLPAGLNGMGFLRMMQDMRGERNDERLNYLLKLFALDPNVNVKEMSLGEKRKLAVVAAFMNDPDVLILDEPTSGLDPVMQQVFISFILEEKKRGKTILLSSHIFSEVDATCDRIAIIKDGKIVSEFKADDLKHASLKQYRIVFNDKENYERFKNTYNKNIISIIKDREIKNKLFITCEDKNINDVVDFLSKFEIKEFNNIKETLEDYFMKFYKEDKEFGGAF